MEINSEYIKLRDKAPSIEINNDGVHHPNYYSYGNIECIDAIRGSMCPDEYRGYLKGCVMKYLWRYEYKENSIQDLEKAKVYLEWLIEACKKDFANGRIASTNLFKD